MKTTRILIVLIAVPLAACTVGAGPGDDTGDDTPVTGELSGSITADRTMMGTVTLTADATVEPGVTLTIAAGSMFEAATGKTLRVRGTLAITGAAGQEVTMLAATSTWAGIVAEGGATVNVQYATGMDVANFLYSKSGSTSTLDHVVMTDVGKASQIEGMVTMTRSRFEGISGITIFPTGNANVTDSYFIGTAGDTVVQTGGTLVMDHSNIGNTATTGDHCAMHLNEGSVATVSNSNISDTSVGLMIGGNIGSTFTSNNFENPDNLQDISLGGPPNSGSFDGNYINPPELPIQGMPINTPAPARILTAGPRP